MLVLFKLELCINFFTPLIWVMSCCFFFFSLSFWVGEGISTSFCLSGTDQGEMSQHNVSSQHIPENQPLSCCLCSPAQTQGSLLGVFSFWDPKIIKKPSPKPSGCSLAATV